jgi:hypothetical protein
MVGGLVGNLVNVGIPAAAGGFLANFVDAKFLDGKSAILRIGAKVAEALGIGILLGRKFPRAAPAAMAGIFGTIGGDFGSHMGGGLPAGGKEVTAKGIAELVAEDERMGVLLTQEMRGMGIVIQGMGAASTQQLLEGYGNGIGAYTNQPVGYGDSESD